MRSGAILRIIAVLTLVSAATTTVAGAEHSIWRWAGLGWGDGYHSHGACPPRHSASKQALQSLPWWAIPADAPSLPSTRDPSRPLPPPGHPPFRPPGQAP